MSQEQDVTKADNLFKGTDKIIQWDIVDSAGAAQVMTGWAVSMLVFRPDGVGGAVLTIAAVISNGDGTDDRATVTIADTDTDAMVADDYVYSLERTDAGSEDVLAFGTWVLRDRRSR